MSSIAFFVVKVYFIIGLVTAGAKAEKLNSTITVADQDLSQTNDETNRKLENLTEKSVGDNIPIIEVPESDNNKSIINPPPRPCQPCYRRDSRGNCRKIVGCQK